MAKKPWKFTAGRKESLRKAQKIHVKYVEDFTQIFDEKNTFLFDASFNKYLIYRYPLDRFIGWYATFIPTVIEDYESPYTTMFKIARTYYEPHLSLIQNCFNFITKQKNIEEMVVSPISNFIILLGFCISSVLRGILIALILNLVIYLFLSFKL